MRRLGLLLFVLAFALPAHAVPISWGLFGSFSPVTHSYTSGSGTETAPVGAHQVVVTDWGGGSSGNCQSLLIGGGSGAQVIKTVAVVGGNTFSYAVGTGGASSVGVANNGNPSTVSGTVSGGSISLTAGGGMGGAGGAAGGGDTDTPGNGHSGDTGGSAPNGGAGGVQGANGSPPGGGGGSGAWSGSCAEASGAGAYGEVEFSYT